MKNCLKLVSALMLISFLFFDCKGEIQYVERIVEVEKTYAASVTFEATGAEGLVNVTMATTTEGAKIYYTTDGTEPSAESTSYSNTVAISEDTVFKAIAVKEGMENSPVSYAKYSVVNKIETKIETKIEEKEVEKIVYTDKVYASPITFTAKDEEYGVSLSLSTQTQGAKICYTTDGSTPTAGSTIYTQALRIEANTTVKAIAIKEGIENSPVSVATVTIKKITQSSGVAGNPLQIALTADVPHENGYTGNKSNTKVTVTASITTAGSVKKVVWKKNGSLIAKTLLADAGATDATVSDDNAKWTFDITANDETANGTYTVAAIDEAGREEAEQITIDQFDFTPPATVSGMTAVFVSSLNKVVLSYKTPGTADFDHVEITYTYNNGETESIESSPTVAAQGQISTTLDTTFDVISEAKIYTFYLRSVDKLGNKSTAVARNVSVASGISAGYQFHDSVEYLASGTNGTAGKNATYAYFGDWPQTIKAQDIEIDETNSMTMGDFTYFKGSDDNWYVKCTENAYNDNYTYSDGRTVAKKSSNSEQYFKVEPIKWRVLNPTATGTEKKILLAENILTANVNYYRGDSRTLNGVSIKNNNYKYSNMRAYLNGIDNQFVTDGGERNSYNDIDWSNKGFLYSAFTASAITQIDDTEVDNSLRSTNPEANANVYQYNENYVCENTTDKIFLLSEYQVTSSSYGFKAYNAYDNTRTRVPTDYAKANYSYITSYNGKYGGFWYLRSPSSFYILSVRESGSADYSVGINTPNHGVVPALCLKE